MAFTALNDLAPGVKISETFNAFTGADGAIASSATALQTAITNAADNPSDPSNLIKMQAAMANYNTSLMVASSVVKSIEETTKSITQKL